MEIWHRLAFSNRDGVEDTINRLGIQYKKSLDLGGGPGFFASFQMAESDARWPAVAELVAEKRMFDIAVTLFTPEEALSAEWIRIQPIFEQGYPQPENKWLEATYQNGCLKCGTGLVQRAPFHIAKEPKLGKHDFVRLYWTDNILATFRVFGAFKASEFRGYEQWPVIIHPTKQPSESVAQVYVVGETAPGLLDAPTLPTEPCPLSCPIPKFVPITRGRIRYRRDALPEGIDFVRSHEWFGSGGFGFQEIFMSNRVVRLIVEQGWRGLALHPLELV